MHKMTNLVLGGALIVLGLLGIVGTLALQSAGPGGAGCPGGLCGSGQRSGVARDVDAMFIQQMIPHHDDAIAMADMALTRAEHPELRQLAEDIRRTQTAENAQMREWYQEWFDAEVPEDSGGSSGMMGGGMMGGRMTDMNALEDAESFDREFIEQMVPHHQMAIMMSRMMGSASGRAEMREFTQGIIETQSAEIELMLGWYEAWYGR
jgi:uncharacterized protein (DUF305 family)